MSHNKENDFLSHIKEAFDEHRCYVPESRNDCQYARRMAARNDIAQPLKGMFADLEAWENLSERDRHIFVCRTLSELHPNWVFCHASAAAIQNLEVENKALETAHVLCGRTSRTRSTDQITRHFNDDATVDSCEGIPVTFILQTAFDCMRSMTFERGLAIADSVIRQYGYSNDDLISYIKRHDRLKGADAALEPARRGDGRAENGGESVARARMIELGFKIPELQVEIEDPLDNGSLYRADFLWRLDDGSELIGELDGKDKYINPKILKGKDSIEALLNERLRESRVSAKKGRRVMRFSYPEVMNRSFFEKLLDAYSVPRDN